jgi:hypothetical protein
MILGAVDVGERGAVDDDVGPRGVHRRGHRSIVGHVEIGARERQQFVVGLALVDDRGRELAVRAQRRRFLNYAAFRARTSASSVVRTRLPSGRQPRSRCSCPSR